MGNNDTFKDTNHRLDSLGDRLDRIEGKLDVHLERVSRTERDVEWLKGHVKLVTTIFLSVIGAVGALGLKYLFPFGK